MILDSLGIGNKRGILSIFPAYFRVKLYSGMDSVMEISVFCSAQLRLSDRIHRNGLSFYTLFLDLRLPRLIEWGIGKE